MSYLVYKKALREEKVREKYMVDRRDLRKARDAGIIDQNCYKEAKKQITPVEAPRERAKSIPSDRPTTARDRANSVYSANSGSSAGSASSISTSAPQKVKKGTIFDRNNLQVRVYKPDAQTEEQRNIKKLQSKAAQLHELETASQLGHADEPNLDVFRNSEEFQRYWGSISSGSSTRSSATGRASKSNRFGFLRPKKSTDQHVPQFPPRTPLSALEPPIPILSRTSSNNYDYGSVPTSPALSSGRWPQGHPISDSSAKSRSRKASVATIQSATATTPKPEIVRTPTLADRMLFGVKATPALPEQVLPVKPLSRRHSFSSGRPSTAASRHSWKWPAPPGTSGGESTYSMKSRKTRDELPYGLTNGYDESHYTPPSLLLLDVFTSLLSEFESTSKIFGYARDEEYHSSCAASMVDSNPQHLHPGQLVGFGDEQGELKAALKKRVWFLMAVKWLYFGRILFSSGHHLLMMGREDPGDGGPPKTGDELRVLDLDGPAMGTVSPFLCLRD